MIVLNAPKTVLKSNRENERDYETRTNLDEVAEPIASIFEPRLLLCPLRADGICNLEAL